MDQETLPAKSRVAVNIRPELDKFREETIFKANAGLCDGACDTHRGDVKAFRVSHISSGTDWGYFAYCAEAIEIDENNGMRLVGA